MGSEKTTVSVDKHAIDQNVIDIEKGAVGVGGDIEIGTTPEVNYDKELFIFLNKTKRGKMLFGEFGMLHRLNLIDIQNDIANCRAVIWGGERASKAEMGKLRVTLREYTQAIRDYDYIKGMTPCSYGDARDWKDDLEDTFKEIGSKPGYPYSTKYTTLEHNIPGTDTLRSILIKILPQSLVRTGGPTNRPFVDELAFSFLPRFAIALISGASLIVPMIIMTLNKSLNKSLITTSAAVMLLASVLSFIIKAKTYDVITTTATYAAVLVVFVGLSS